MADFLIIIHLLIALVMIGIVLIQKSEGGALGIGGGGGFMSARGAASFLTRATGILAALFMLTSIGLTMLSRDHGQRSLIDRIPTSETVPAPAAPTPSVPDVLPPAAPSPGGVAAPAESPAIPAPAVPAVPDVPAPPKN